MLEIIFSHRHTTLICLPVSLLFKHVEKNPVHVIYLHSFRLSISNCKSDTVEEIRKQLSSVKAVEPELKDCLSYKENT
jgi:hypothetical protein